MGVSRRLGSLTVINLAEVALQCPFALTITFERVWGTCAAKSVGSLHATVEASLALIGYSASHHQSIVEQAHWTKSSQWYSLVSEHADLMEVLADGSLWRKRYLSLSFIAGSCTRAAFYFGLCC